MNAIATAPVLEDPPIDSGKPFIPEALTPLLAMNSGYAMLHEAEHNLLHPNPKVNQTVGALLALFFPAPFHLIRQGHIGHHVRNRSDDEAFDLYFEDENRFWKYVQLYGTLTGLFWVLIFLTNFVVLFKPTIITPRYTKFNRPTEAFLDSLNPRYRRLIQLEALAAILLHAAMIWFWKISLLNYFAVMFGFGLLWSAMQYAHHYGTERDVQKGGAEPADVRVARPRVAESQLASEPSHEPDGALDRSASS